MAGIVREEQCGITVPYGDVEALKKAIVQLKNDKGLREQLGENGRRAFVSKYNWDLMEKELVSLYSEVLSSK
jgi:glycosyltransferase involved in cell wall biosynthesis